MKYFAIYIPNLQTNGAPPTPEKNEAMQKFVGESIARGEFVSGGGFLPLAKTGCIVRRTDGTSHVIDGPYVESKELVGGFAILNYDSREAALDGAKRFLEVAGDGECISYQVDEGEH